jgi:lysine 2,3-aminomutase
VKDSEWNDWKWQLRNRIRSLSDLERIINLSDDEINAISRNINALPLAITPYYASLISKDDPTHSIRRTVIPTTSEYIKMIGEADDPLSEDHDSPVPGIVHRYPDRVLFLTTGYCSVYCRYCTRSRMVGDGCKSHFTMDQWEKGIKYIESNSAIRDVLLSGGDPLTLSNEKLNWLLSRLSKIPHVEFIRIGTKIPAVLPQRITSALTDILKKYHPLWISIHFTHPDEITKETAEACRKLADAGIPLGSQTVLLQGINDDVETMKKLYHSLLKIRVRPYYLYQCDPITGSSHFRTPVEKGIDIISGLRGHTTGYAVPHYVIDAPDGGGKIPLLPDYFAGRDGQHVVLRNYEGNIYKYPDNVGEPVIC